MTRRVVKPQPHPGIHSFVDLGDCWKPAWGEFMDRPENRDEVTAHNHVLRCPYGVPGDRLWVREGHALVPRTAYWHDPHLPHQVSPDGNQWAVYREGWDRCQPGKWRPSIHMHRWASRILLENTGVRIERVRDITEEDARSEGLACVTKDGSLYKYGIPDADGLPGGTGWPWAEWEPDPIAAFRKLWDSINAARGYGWDSNPSVWVINFRVLEICGRPVEARELVGAGA